MESSAPPASPSLKKLKREAAQRRKAQARSLKLRADEQERLQRLEIDALVEQQRLQRLERQRCEELAAARSLQGSSVPSSTTASGTVGDGRGSASQHQAVALSQTHDGKYKPLPTTKSQHHQQQQQESNSRGIDRDRPNSCMPDADQHHLHKSKLGGSKSNDGIGGGGTTGGGWRGKECQRSKHAQQQSMRAAVESRRRLARGPRSGVVTDAHPTLPSEDHRVVNTEYQAAGTQALMRVTLLAAGFVIGARGISARLIGQVTGAIVQSWTESCRPDALPIRLFRIQGKKAVVQAAVALIGQAVAKYKDLCDCKRRGEFVQREHIINGVEFYYQPPPRKAFAINAPGPDQPGPSPQPCCSSKSDPGGGLNIGNSGSRAGNAGGHGGSVASTPGQQQLSFTPHHVWLQHLHAQQQQKQQQLQEQAVKSVGMAGENRSLGGSGSRTQTGGTSFFDWRSQQQQQQQGLGNSNQVGQLQQGGSLKGGGGGSEQRCQDSLPLQQCKDTAVQQILSADGGKGVVTVVDARCTSTVSEMERIDQGLQQSVASLEQALQQVRLEQRLLQHNRAVTETVIGPPGGGGLQDNSRGGGIVVGNSLQQQVGTDSRGSSLWADSSVHSGGGGGHERAPGFQLGSSLFSIFGSGELPLPISSSTHDHGRSSGGVDGSPAAAANCALQGLQQVNSSMASSTTGGPFDFPRCDFLRESLHAFPFAPRDTNTGTGSCNGSVSEYSLYGHSKNVVVAESQTDTNLCIVCLEQPAGVRLMGLVNCPLCREKIVGLHQCPSSGRASSSAGPTAGAVQQQRGGPAVAAKLNGSSYHLWNWVPGASV